MQANNELLLTSKLSSQNMKDYTVKWMNSYFFPSTKLIYDPILKCGNSSVLLGFLVNEGIISYSNSMSLAADESPIALARIQDLARPFKIRSNKRFYELLNNYQRICFIREPIERLASAINDKLIFKNKIIQNSDRFNQNYWSIANTIFEHLYWIGELQRPPQLEEIKKGFSLNDFLNNYLFLLDPDNLNWHFIPYSRLIKNKELCIFLSVNSIDNFIEKKLNLVPYKANKASGNLPSLICHNLNINVIDCKNFRIKNLTDLLINSIYKERLLDLYSEDFDLFNLAKNNNINLVL